MTLRRQVEVVMKKHHALIANTNADEVYGQALPLRNDLCALLSPSTYQVVPCSHRETQTKCQSVLICETELTHRALAAECPAHNQKRVCPTCAPILPTTQPSREELKNLIWPHPLNNLLQITFSSVDAAEQFVDRILDWVATHLRQPTTQPDRGVMIRMLRDADFSTGEGRVGCY